MDDKFNTPVGRLELHDGTTFDGFLYGSCSSTAGEVVFQTGMVGYIESLTDPSYHSQLLVLTYPSIGNYGVPSISELDELGLPRWFESKTIYVRALIVSELCQEYSHFSATQSLNSWLSMNGVTCLSHIDTRTLTLKLREHGTMLGRIYQLPVLSLPSWLDPATFNLVSQVSCSEKTIFNPSGDVNVGILDCGIKYNQIRCFCKRGAKVTLLPWSTDLSQCADDFDALFVSNGPGDPAQYSSVVSNIQTWLKTGKPLFGICLGHQLVARAIGMETYKMKYGNRGHNQPCIHVETQRCFTTSQNHGYAVHLSSMPDGWYELFRNANDQSNEGLAHRQNPWVTVQFHPEHMAGPRDLEFLFDVFLDHVRSPSEMTLDNRITKAITYQQLPYEQFLTCTNNRPKKVLILGSGGLSIGQAGEFDYSGSQALKALREEEIQTLLVNPNVATVQTTAGMADKIFLLPVTPDCVTRVIESERPDGVLISFGGQTGLTCGLALANTRRDCSSINCGGDSNDRKLAESVLDMYNCRILGTSAATIEITEDRQKFADAMRAIGEQVAPAAAATTVKEAARVASSLGYPVLIRAAFALGGMGSGFAENAEELERLAARALSQTTQIFIDKSLKGWKEVEYEVVRDAYNNCIAVCNMENIDPVGIHTGESIVVAPSQTLSNVEYNVLRSVAIKVACFLHIIGECNIQFALDPHSSTYYIIEVNARLSRSSALASKATGYPLAYIAAKLCIGRSLPELTNVVTEDQTTACFEPSLDYCVVKVPRWDLSKFTRVSRNIGSSMKSVGEVMAISRCFEEAIQKALRMSKPSIPGFDGTHHLVTEKLLSEPTDQRIIVLATALKEGWSIDHIHELTHIDRWFLSRLAAIVECQKELEMLPDGLLTKLNNLFDCSDSQTSLDFDMPSLYRFVYQLAKAKRMGFSDRQIALALHSSALAVRQFREQLCFCPSVRKIDTVAGEWPATTNYLYLTYTDIPLAKLFGHQHQCPSTASFVQFAQRTLDPSDIHDVQFNPKTQIMVLGSGVYRIGSSVEFDWCAVECVRELRRLGWSPIMLNCNPETVSTDFDMCDRLYFDELSLERVLDVFKLEQALGVIVSMGGQTPNNIAMSMHRLGIPILGTSAESIDNAENRFKFSRLLDGMGISQPRWRELTDLSSARTFCKEVGYPCLVRPSYVLSGAAMNVAYDDQDLVAYLSAAKAISPEHPVVISQFILDAKEIDVDAVAQSGRVVAIAVSEHVENAGVHSGDATLVTPPQDLNAETLDRIRQLVHNLADELQVSGPLNLQLIAKDNRLQIIEANLRVSRSFPFVSKTLKYDFVAAATRCILGSARDSIYPPSVIERQQKGERISVSHGFLEPTVDVTDGIPGVVGVKVPVFSFSRLLGADVLLGVEMVSTGEVACFGRDRYEAYLLAQSAALFNTNGRLPKPKENIFLSIGSYRHKKELLTSIAQLARLGYTLYGSVGTADYYETQGIHVTPIEWPYEESDVARSMISQSSECGPCERTVQQYLAEKQFALIVSLTMRKIGNRRPTAFVTRGYMTRRLAVETNVPLITDVKVLKLLAEALFRHSNGHEVLESGSNSSLLPVRQATTATGERRFPLIQCITSSQILYLPGLIDVHVHTRDPGQEHKEDWGSVTLAALAGGIVTIFAMPNTNPALVDEASYRATADRAASRAYCDYALYAGATTDNAGSIGQLARHVIGLKMYLNETFTTLSLAGKMDIWQRHFETWPLSRPICCHAEGETMAAVLLLAELTDRPVHICHVARKSEIEIIRKAKLRNLKVTCEVCPHHLFLTEDDMPKVGGWREVRPRLGTKEDVDALWANLDVIDCFATDHAPHLPSEKSGEHAPPGYPGLETMLPLLLTAMQEGRLTLADLIERLYVNPRRIFNLDNSLKAATDSLDRYAVDNTWVEVDMGAQWCLPGSFTSSVTDDSMSSTLFTRAKWSPFAGRRFRGKVRRVMIRGELAFVDNKVLVKPGFGINLAEQPITSSKSKFPEIPPVDTPEQTAAVVGPSSPPPRMRLESCGERFPDELGAVGAIETRVPVSAEHATAPSLASAQIGTWIDGVSGRHVLSASEFSKSAIHRIFNLAHSFRQAILKNKCLDHICRGKVLASLFFEPSTRTANSFTVAMQRLGGSVVHFTEHESSLVKGETLSDTLRILAAYSDCLVIRHPGKGTVQCAASAVAKPVINAGDGVGEHPTQALLDVFTIREEIGTVNGLTVTMVGDLAHGRTVHSLARLLCLYKVRLRYVTHSPELAMPNEVKQYVAARGIPQEEMSSLAEALPDTDVVYMTRVQAERIKSADSLAAGQFVITPELMTLAKKCGMIVMHPLPRVGEISPSFDSDPRAAYFRQAEYGVYVRMALLATVLAHQKQ